MADLGIISCIFLTDLGVKNYIEKTREMNSKETAMGERLILTRYHNTGAMLDLLHKRPAVVAGLSVFFTAGAALYALKKGKKAGPAESLGLSLILGGGLCNTYDRVVRGFVVDYFSFNVKQPRLKRIVFNLSDMCLFAGIFLVMADYLIPRKRDPR